ncbi:MULTISPECIES: inorganic phosphate transporter [unclassified Coleofasciculus]|uniref:inorganic phosphate transporter n=1 Tax=unclassified Coleofasciculus TaxID=2692782 RepID=UPI00187FA439|nr:MULTISPECIES: inorganic phosphate transporter [unclassified Coleofasciculus]MBE9126257.1 anion permease [Coleofasciculus sp. LEGE 07081]MBE9148146.1 anion permease [Coleofasciculus sp. LEGE 07092]
MMGFVLFIATVFLAYSNGANDNFKGVATLFGSQTTNYKVAIFWATITTFLGSFCSIFLAGTLLKIFSGKGFVPDAIANDTDFHLAVAIGAGLTIILATQTGFPISTTHGLTGALVGAGLIAIGTQVNFLALGSSFFLPLLLSPILAIILGTLMYGVFHFLRVYLGINKEWCVCTGNIRQLIPIPQADSPNLLEWNTMPDVTVNTTENCTERYKGRFLGINSQQLVDSCHFLSAGIVSFARGLNDTPKIVSLILMLQAISIQGGMLAIALRMAAGGLLNARKVAETMSKKITMMNHGQGFSSNLVTGILVIAASQYGFPVSTTHVSVGSIFGVGLISRKAKPTVFYQILLSWVLTLPIAGIISGMVYWILHR